MNDPLPQCVFCQASSDDLPLIALRYQESDFYICPSHLPLLIHKPQTLMGLLPGADKLQPYEG